jgi:phosphate transport system substrate-binding protein
VSWKELGGKDVAIHVVNRKEGATQDLLIDYLKIKARDIQQGAMALDNEQAIILVAGDADAIGYAAVGMAEADVKEGMDIKLLAVGGVAATSATVSSGSFPLSRTLALVSSEEPAGLARAFIDYASSHAVDDVLAKQFFVPPPRQPTQP